MNYFSYFSLVLLLGFGLMFNACEQDEIVPPDNPPVDTTPVDTTSTLLPPGSFDFVLVRVVSGISSHMPQLYRWAATYELVNNGLNPDSISLKWESVQVNDGGDYFSMSTGDTAQQVTIRYGANRSDVVKLTLRYGNQSGTVTKTFQINQIYPLPPPSFDIYQVMYYQLPPTRPNGSTWDDIFHTYDTTQVPEFMVRTSVHEQLHSTSAAIYPDSQMVVRSDRIPLYFTNEGTPDYNLHTPTNLLLYDWDGPGIYDTLATLQFVASQHKVPGSDYAKVTFQQAGFHIELYLRYNYYP